MLGIVFIKTGPAYPYSARVDFNYRDIKEVFKWSFLRAPSSRTSPQHSLTII